MAQARSSTRGTSWRRTAPSATRGASGTCPRPSTPRDASRPTPRGPSMSSRRYDFWAVRCWGGLGVG